MWPAIQEIISVFTNEWFYLTTIALLYWTVDKHISFKLFIVLTLTLYIHAFIYHLIAEHSFPFLPAEPVQLATAFWGYFIAEVSNRKFTLFACVMIFLVSLVTLLHGFYTLQHVIIAMLLGVFIIYAVYRTRDWMNSAPESLVFSCSLVLPSALLLLFPEGAVACGLLLGGGVGYSVETIKNRMVYPHQLMKRVIAGVIGFIGLFLLIYLHTWLFHSVLTTFLHSALVGLWITLIYPLLMIYFGWYKQDGGLISKSS